MKVLLSREAIRARVAEMGREIARDYAGREPHLVGVLKGACTFMTDLAREIELPLTLDYIAVSSYGAATKTSGEVKLVKDLDQGLEGRDLIVVEDIVDTGLTLNYLLNVLKARGPPGRDQDRLRGVLDRGPLRRGLRPGLQREAPEPVGHRHLFVSTFLALDVATERKDKSGERSAIHSRGASGGFKGVRRSTPLLNEFMRAPERARATGAPC